MGKELIDNICILTPEINHLDSLNANEFTDSYIKEIKEAQKIILDLSRIQFVDSSGLGALLSLIREGHDKNVKICVCNALPSVKVLFRMVQLAKLIPIFNTKEEAINWSSES